MHHWDTKLTELNPVVAGYGVQALFNPSAEFAASFLELAQNQPVIAFFERATISYALSYHFAGGLRHLFWDSTVKGLDLESVNRSSYAVIGAAALLGTVLLFSSSD